MSGWIGAGAGPLRYGPAPTHDCQAPCALLSMFAMPTPSSAPFTPQETITEAEADARLTDNRADILALIAKADHRRDGGDNRAANAYYSAAVRIAASSPALNVETAAQVTRAQAAVGWLGEVFKQHLLGALTRAGYPRDKQHPRFRLSLDMMLGEAQRPPEHRLYPQTPLVHYYPGTDYLQFADVSEYQWVPKLEAQFPAMRAEALALLADHAGFMPYVKTDNKRPQGDFHGMLENPDWSTLYLWQNGAAVDEHVGRCPTIYQAVIDHVPLCHIGPRAPSVMLSLLRPGAKIPPHTGMLNSRLICHLPLVVPPDCGFRVGGKTIEWTEGKMIAFDDSVEHEAWNNSAYDRLVLIFDIWRPELSREEQEQVTAMFAAVDNYS
jgi:aspartyl/asparaginyl beta-hydroxylase (cupin superfamily)